VFDRIAQIYKKKEENKVGFRAQRYGVQPKETKIEWAQKRDGSEGSNQSTVKVRNARGLKLGDSRIGQHSDWKVLTWKDSSLARERKTFENGYAKDQANGADITD